jgi:hypothetical protein
VADLVSKYFSSELDRAEEESLEGLLDSSAKESERFSDMALSEYRAMGLPDASKGWTLPAWKAGHWIALCLAGGGLAWLLWPCAPKPRPDLALEGGTFGVEARRSLDRMDDSVPTGRLQALPPIREEAPRLNLDRQAARPAPRRGSLLGLLVKQASAGPARVWVRDAAGAEVQRIYSGQLGPGEWRFEWDGRLADGTRAAPGTYTIAVQRGASLQTEQVHLKPRNP